MCCRCSRRGWGTPECHLPVRTTTSFDSGLFKLLDCWWPERLRASRAQAAGALALLLPGVRANAHHDSSLLSISPWPRTVLGPLLLVS